MRRGWTKRFLLFVLCLLGFLLFSMLGLWQIERRSWKLDLIARVNARVHASAVPAPAAGEWPSLNLRNMEYRHVSARGDLRHDQETLVDALTERGPGYWVITPLTTGAGTILVNRGFVPADRAEAHTRPAGPLKVTGLVRLTEPGGRLLRPNRPGDKRWYSRDVAAIASARALGPVAPFFIDADAAPEAQDYPVGGLTVIRFRNTHLIYALTWFGLAALSLVGLVLLAKPTQVAKDE